MEYDTKAQAIMTEEQFLNMVNVYGVFAAVGAARTQSVPCLVVKAWVSAILASMKK
jgi:hypothetical protein